MRAARAVVFFRGVISGCLVQVMSGADNSTNIITVPRSIKEKPPLSLVLKAGKYDFCLLLSGGRDTHAEMLYANLYLEGCGKFFNVRGFAFYSNDFKAVVMVEVNVLG